MWIARNKNGSLFVYRQKPKKKKNKWVPPYMGFAPTCLRINNSVFPEVKWEDDEPRELVLKVSDN